jgi:hypothetical protein
MAKKRLVWNCKFCETIQVKRNNFLHQYGSIMMLFRYENKRVVPNVRHNPFNKF